jgi:hypothetical protein
MTRAISRDSFDELKQYTGVHLQQGRVILDADWNESQDIMASLVRRVGQDALRDGVAADGFEIQPVIPPVVVPPGRAHASSYALMHAVTAGLAHYLRFPGTPVDTFESLDGWAASAQCNRRLSRDQPFEGKTFLRVSGHSGAVTLTKTLPAAVDWSAFQVATFRFRVNQSISVATPPQFYFFVEDQAGNRNRWRVAGLANAKDTWTPALIQPLDLKFHIVDTDMLPAYRNQGFGGSIICAGAPGATATWAVTSGALPAGVTLTANPGANYGTALNGNPTANGNFNFTLTATSAGSSVSRAFSLRVQDAPSIPQLIDFGNLSFVLAGYWGTVVPERVSRPTGTAANLQSIRKYGFEIFQDPGAPITWDFDSLQLGSRQMLTATAANNFIIAGSLQQRLVDHLQLKAVINDTPYPALAAFASPASARLYAGGLPATLTRDTLYSGQADPTDPALTTPTGSAVRRDLVYLDVWREPVTYVEDPEIREIALGGPDTSTRMRLRQRVRVAQGGTLPAGDGTGQGTLTTEGTYTDKSNRLYLVEIDTPGDVGTATFRWSDDNASTIQRVIEAVTAGATKLKVEDASAFQAGDFVLLRKEFLDEEHRVAGVFGNVVTLQAATVASFALGDRAKLQRWGGFRTAIAADPNDPPLSTGVDLSHGVRVRFGGKAMRKGDTWTFRTRYLAGEAASGSDPAARIEALEFQRARGTVHQYTPLALLYRDPGAQDPARIKVVRDRRRRAGTAVASRTMEGVTLATGQTLNFGVELGTTSDQSSFLCFFSASTTANAASIRLTLTVRLYNSEMTDPGAAPQTGKVKEASTLLIVDALGDTKRSATITVPCSLGVDAPAEINAAHLFVTGTTGTQSVTFSDLQLHVLEVRNQAVILHDVLALDTVT